MNVKEIDWSEEITEEDFEDILNDSCGTVMVCGYEMEQGSVLRECDNVAFREAYNNYLDNEAREQGGYECGECEEKYQEKNDAEECCSITEE